MPKCPFNDLLIPGFSTSAILRLTFVVSGETNVCPPQDDEDPFTFHLAPSSGQTSYLSNTSVYNQMHVKLIAIPSASC